MIKENNHVINKFLLVGDKFMPELHLWDPNVKKYSACGPLTKHQERINQFMKDGRLSHLYKNRLDKACFQHDVVYNKYTKSGIVLKYKAYKIAADLNYDGFQRALSSMVWKCFDERSKNVLGSGVNNEKLAEELHKPIIRNFKRRKMYSSFKDNIWVVDLADMTLLSKFNKGIKYLLCVIDLFSRFAWVVPLKNKKSDSIIGGFQSVLNSSKRKPSKTWVDHGSEFYNKNFKDFLKEKDIEMYSTFNEGKSVVAERFIKTLKNKIYKHMPTVGKSVYFDVLDDIVKKYNNRYHSSIKIKPKDVTNDSFVEYV